MTWNQQKAAAAALFAAATFAGCASAGAAERYVAELTPLNADKLGSSASGKATFEVENGKLKTTITLKGLRRFPRAPT